MGYKEDNQETYNKYSEKFNEKFEKHFHKYVKDKAESYLSLLKGKDILDLGSGSGNHAEYFKSKGFNVLCFDSSISMLEICKKKDLKTKQGDIEELDFPDKSFDGVWAYASLLHVPKKKIKNVLERIYQILKPEGIFQLSWKE